MIVHMRATDEFVEYPDPDDYEGVLAWANTNYHGMMVGFATQIIACNISNTVDQLARYMIAWSEMQNDIRAKKEKD